MSPDEAVEFSRVNFPYGPESLIERLGICVHYSEMIGCDGWCLNSPDRSVIRVNSTQVNSRKRFTLAHELGHLLLGIPSVVGETFSEMLRSNSREEIRVNRLAAELLLPLEVVKQHIGKPPIAGQILKRLAKAANVSPLTAALRLVNSAEELEIGKALIVYFEGDDYKWSRSLSINASPSLYSEILQGTRGSDPNPLRYKQNDGQIVFASAIANPKFSSTVLFIQLLDADQEQVKSGFERCRELESKLFGQGGVKRPSVEGCLSTIKTKVDSSSSLLVAEAAFWERYTGKFAETILNSNDGNEYVRIRLSQWFK